jgi:hypothetical protein
MLKEFQRCLETMPKGALANKWDKCMNADLK